MIEIIRERYVIVDNKDQIFCGLARHYNLKPLNNIGDMAIKTYLSANKARSSFLSSWFGSKPEDFETGKYRVVKVTESVKEMGDE